MANDTLKNVATEQNAQVNESQAQGSADDDWELPGQACTLRPGMPGFEDCEACQ